jgi:serine/threonine protein kinase
MTLNNNSFPGYEILQSLSKTDYGYNFRARHLDTDKIVLLKIFTARSHTPPQGFQTAREDIKHNVKLLHRLDHPQIAPYGDYFKTTDSSGREYRILVQDWINGKPYSHNIQAQPFSELQAFQFLQSLLSVLTYLHNHRPQIIHGNLSPDHILFDEDSKQPILINFSGPQRALAQNATSPVLQAIGARSLFSPPERRPISQRQRIPASPTDDLYGLAVTVICLLTGKSDPASLYDNIRNRWHWQPALPKGTKLSANFIRVLETMLHPAIDKRYPSAEEVYNALQNLNTPGQPTAPPDLGNIGYIFNNPLPGMDSHIFSAIQGSAIDPPDIHTSPIHTPGQEHQVLEPAGGISGEAVEVGGSLHPDRPISQGQGHKDKRSRRHRDPSLPNTLNVNHLGGHSRPKPQPEQEAWEGLAKYLVQLEPVLTWSLHNLIIPSAACLVVAGLLHSTYRRVTQHTPDPKACIAQVEARRRTIGLDDAEVSRRIRLRDPNAPLLIDSQDPSSNNYIQLQCYISNQIMDEQDPTKNLTAPQENLNAER